MTMAVPQHRRRFRGLVAVAAWLSGASAAFGHAEYMTFIQHRADVTVGVENIDVVIELTFFEVRSMAERRRMDANHDGRITDAERDAYAARLVDVVHGAVSMRVDGRALDVIPLYDPQVDLLGVDQIAPTHHVLRLCLFARTPAWLRAGSRIELSDGLWSRVPALRMQTGRGEDGIQIDVTAETQAAAVIAYERTANSPRAGDAGGAMTDSPAPLVTVLRCEAMPAARAGTPRSIAAGAAGRHGGDAPDAVVGGASDGAAPSSHGQSVLAAWSAVPWRWSVAVGLTLLAIAVWVGHVRFARARRMQAKEAIG